MTDQITFNFNPNCKQCAPNIDKLEEIIESRKPYMNIKLDLVLTRDVGGMDYWHIHSLKVGEAYSSNQSITGEA